MPPTRTKRKKKLARSYHHGNLRAALIEASLGLIEKKGVRALTLREIGARLGVSRTAAYRHFADKADLFLAICDAGFKQFADALEAARQSAETPFASRLTALNLAYVRFAADHPAYFEVMFGGAGPPSKPARPEGDRAFGILEETIRQGQETGEVRAGDSVELACFVWAEVHGISMLRLAEHLEPDGAGTRFVEYCSEILCCGLRTATH